MPKMGGVKSTIGGYKGDATGIDNRIPKSAPAPQPLTTFKVISGLPAATTATVVVIGRPSPAGKVVDRFRASDREQEAVEGKPRVDFAHREGSVDRHQDVGAVAPCAEWVRTKRGADNHQSMCLVPQINA